MRSENLSSPEELLLVAISEGKSRMTCCYLSYGLAGAAIGDLLIAGKIAIEDNRVVVKDTTPAGNETLDRVFANIRNSSKQRRLSGWISRLGNTSVLRHTARVALIRRALVQREERLIFGLIPHTVYSVTDPSLVNPIRTRVLAALRDPLRAGSRDQLELGIASSIDIGLLRREEKRQWKAELKLLAERDPVAIAVKQVIQETESAAAVAVLVAAG